MRPGEPMDEIMLRERGKRGKDERSSLVEGKIVFDVRQYE